MEEELEIEYGKLVGDNFEYRIFTSSIILGRNKSSKRYKKVKVDVDLCSLGGIKDLISGHHARIFYDFYRRSFAVEVLGRCGCYIDGVLHLPGDPPVKLQPNNLVKIGGIEFYLVPTLLFGASNSMDATNGSNNEKEVGFAKLIGDNFEYYMQTYSIRLGRNSKISSVDIDLSSLGGGRNISRHHATIFYDFSRRCFALEVLGRNGCFVDGVHHSAGCFPVQLKSKNLLKIGRKEFYFMLPLKSILNSGPVAMGHDSGPGPGPGGAGWKRKCDDEDDHGIGGGVGGCGDNDMEIEKEGYLGFFN